MFILTYPSTCYPGSGYRGSSLSGEAQSTLTPSPLLAHLGEHRVVPELADSWVCP